MRLRVRRLQCWDWRRCPQGSLGPLPSFNATTNHPPPPSRCSTYVSKCGNGDFYVKADDDVFVHPLLLRRRLEEVAPDKARLGLYMGTFWVDARPIRDSSHKNFEPNWKGEFYTPYAAGPFYILSRSACAFVGDNALTLNWRWRNEDMAMGTWMAEADAEFVTDWHIKILDSLRYEEPLIAEHYALVRALCVAEGACPKPFLSGARTPPPLALFLTLAHTHTHARWDQRHLPTYETARRGGRHVALAAS